MSIPCSNKTPDTKTQFDTGIKMIISAHETQITFLNNELYRLHSELESLHLKYTKIEESYTSLLKEKTKIESKLTKASSTNKNLLKQINSLTKAHKELKYESTNLHNKTNQPILFTGVDTNKEYPKTIQVNYLTHREGNSSNHNNQIPFPNSKKEHCRSFSVNNSNNKNESNTTRTASTRNTLMQQYNSKNSLSGNVKHSNKLVKYVHNGYSTIGYYKEGTPGNASKKKAHSMSKTLMNDNDNDDNCKRVNDIKSVMNVNKSYTGGLMVSGRGFGEDEENNNNSKFFQKCRKYLSQNEYTKLHNIILLYNANEINKEDMYMNVNKLLLGGNYEELIKEFQKMFT